MRQIVLDTETTGLEPELGHRIIELCCIEIVNRGLGETFHSYFNPEREIDAGALQVHRITRKELEGKPLFSETCDDFLEFVRGAEVIIHNAPFDLGFLDAELARAGHGRFEEESGCGIVDMLELARDLHPGLRNSLDALCERYNVDNSTRDVHGARLDAELLARVYLAVTGGQINFSLDPSAVSNVVEEVAVEVESGLTTPVIRATPEELAAHEHFVSQTLSHAPEE